MASKKKTKKNQDTLLEKAQYFIARRIYDAIALVFGGLALLSLVSILSYHNADPSFNTAASANSDIHNWFGSTGALWADFFIQTIGLAALLVVPIFISWALHIHNRRPVKHKTLRLLSLLVGLLSASITFAAIPNSGEWIPHAGFGGASGTLLLNSLNSMISQLLPGAYMAVTITLTSIIAFLGLAYSAAWSLPEWKAGLQWAMRMLYNGYIYAVHITQKLGYWLKIYGEKPEAPAIIKKPAPTVKKEAATRPTQTAAPASPNTSAEQQKNLPIVQKAEMAAKPSNAGGSLFTTAKGDEDWILPSIDLLQEPPQEAEEQIDERALQNNAVMLQQILEDYKVEGEIVKVRPGPVVTLYELEPAPGVKSSRIIGLSDDIARSMSAISVRAAVVPGQSVIGIELPNQERKTVYMRDVLESQEYAKTKARLPLVLGKDIGGKEIIADLAKMPHLLIAGTTGSGKSVAINTMLLSLLYNLSPDQCRLVMIDPKMLELSVYDGIPHLLAPVVTEPGKAIMTLKWLVAEMENRYRAMSKMGVRNIDGYNQRMKDALKKGDILTRKVQTGFDPETGKPVFEDQPLDMSELPYIVVIVDEFADLMVTAGKEVEAAIQRLAQMARAAGIHIIMATQRPSVDVITGVIKANFPTRISFSVSSKIDSRTILGDGGAEQLLGMGDMLYMPAGGQLKRVHGPFVSDDEVEDVVKHLKSQGEPDYVDIFTGEGGSSFEGAMQDMFGGGDSGSDVDELYDQAVALVAREQRASTSFIQRCLQIGYNRAARIIEEMERQGVVSKASPTGKRDILVGDHGGDGDRDTGT